MSATARSDADPIASQLRVVQIVAAAAIIATIGVTIVAFVIASQPQPAQQARQAAANKPDFGGIPIFSLIAAAGAVVGPIFGWIVAKKNSDAALARLASSPKADPKTELSQLLPIWTVSVIMRTAILEGSTLPGAISYMIEGDPRVLVVIGVGVALMILWFPTEIRLRDWLDNQKQAIALARQTTSRT